ncbi:hypothetical protein ACFVAD_02130 [Sutcliffiella sp. NPDC057660]
MMIITGYEHPLQPPSNAESNASLLASNVSSVEELQAAINKDNNTTISMG